MKAIYTGLGIMVIGACIWLMKGDTNGYWRKDKTTAEEIIFYCGMGISILGCAHQVMLKYN